MKTILIETASNGWIVRPFGPSPSCTWTTIGSEVIAVYNKIEDLQSDIPKLLDQVKNGGVE